MVIGDSDEDEDGWEAPPAYESAMSSPVGAVGETAFAGAGGRGMGNRMERFQRASNWYDPADAEGGGAPSGGSKQPKAAWGGGDNTSGDTDRIRKLSASSIASMNSEAAALASSMADGGYRDVAPSPHTANPGSPTASLDGGYALVDPVTSGNADGGSPLPLLPPLPALPAPTLASAYEEADLKQRAVSYTAKAARSSQHTDAVVDPQTIEGAGAVSPRDLRVLADDADADADLKDTRDRKLSRESTSGGAAMVKRGGQVISYARPAPVVEERPHIPEPAVPLSQGTIDKKDSGRIEWSTKPTPPHAEAEGGGDGKHLLGKRQSMRATQRAEKLGARLRSRIATKRDVVDVTQNRAVRPRAFVCLLFFWSHSYVFVRGVQVCSCDVHVCIVAHTAEDRPVMSPMA